MLDCRLFNHKKFCLIGFIHMLRNIFFSIILCLVICTGQLSIAAAGQVTLEISTTTHVTDDRVLAEVKVTNRGTETARQVSAQGFLPNKLIRAKVRKPASGLSGMKGCGVLSHSIC